ncbi:hypothetical protein HZH68_000851 [Vespula germanica]|uniref:Uncharacterized protein n=1 Tax=Vespula germanica TaxID=30212 RepID=A0A834NUI8_VESGE|nr:hypothetical protein HZH68_000851 [Vespula germanica]
MIPGEPPRGQSPHPALINCVRLRLKNLYPALRGSSTITSNNSMMRERVIIAGNRLAVLLFAARGCPVWVCQWTRQDTVHMGEHKPFCYLLLKLENLGIRTDEKKRFKNIF